MLPERELADPWKEKAKPKPVMVKMFITKTTTP
jgi:hypothetical protein